MERNRPEMYYLDSARDGEYIFYADNTIGLLDSRQSTRQVQVPSRVPGKYRTHQTTQTETYLKQTIASFPDLKRTQSYELTQTDYDQEALQFIPAEVIAEMRQWQNSITHLSSPAIEQAAETMTATEQERQTEQIDCQYCNDNDYACYESGWSKHYWKYPMLDVGSGDSPQLVSLDVAGAIAYSPDLLAISDKYKLTSQDQLIVHRVASLDLSKISAAYIGGDDSDRLVVNDSDAYAGRKISVLLDRWIEQGAWEPEHPSKGDPIQNPSDVIRALQSAVAQGNERVEITDYRARWKEVRQALGQAGMALSWQFGYRGMGDSDAQVYLVDEATLRPQRHVDNSYEGRMMVDAAHRILIQGKDQPSYQRPDYSQYKQ